MSFVSATLSTSATKTGVVIAAGQSLIILAIDGFGGSKTLTISDGTNAYAVRGTQNEAFNNQTVTLIDCLNPTPGTYTLTLAGATGGGPQFLILIYSGGLTYSAGSFASYDSNTAWTSTTDGTTTPAITPASYPALVVGLGLSSSAGGLVAGTDFTSRFTFGSTGFKNYAEDLTLASGSHIASFTAPSATDANVVVAAAYILPSSGTNAALAVTEGADTISSAATLPIAAALAKTEGADTISAATTSPAAGVNAALAVTEGADTISAAATLPIAVALAKTEGADTIAAAATSPAAGTNAALAVVEGADTVSAAAALPVAVSLVKTEGADSISAGSTLPIAISAPLTEGADTLSSTATAFFAMNAAITEGLDALSSGVVLAIGAALTKTEGADTVLSAAQLLDTMNAAITEGLDTLAASMGQVVVANASIVEGADRLTSIAMIIVAPTGAVFVIDISVEAITPIEIRSDASVSIVIDVATSASIISG